MKVENISLKETYGLQGGNVQALIGEKPFDFGGETWKRPAMVVVPGGGYGMVSRREAEPIAFRFMAKGFQVFILDYLCAPTAHYPEQLLELACTVDYIRKNAERFGVNPKEVFAVGFSAGGHLVGNLSTDYMQAVEAYGKDLDCKLTASGLCYPVISPKYGHVGSFDNLLIGYTEEAQAELLKTLNLDQAVTKDTPPAFIWTTAADSIVPSINSLYYAAALANAGVEYELHVHPRGDHGAATGGLEINGYYPELVNIKGWIGECSRFFRMYTVEKM